MQKLQPVYGDGDSYIDEPRVSFREAITPMPPERPGEMPAQSIRYWSPGAIISAFAGLILRTVRRR